jgi:hypothetical protein
MAGIPCPGAEELILATFIDEKLSALPANANAQRSQREQNKESALLAQLENFQKKLRLKK